MNRKQRIEYLFTYYSFLLIPVAILVVVIILIIGANSQKEPVFTGFGIDVTLTEEATSYVTEQWLDTQGYDAKNQRVIFSHVIGNDVYMGQDPDAPRLSSNGTMTISTHIAAQALDYILLDEGTMKEMSPLAFGDLTQILSQQQLTELEDYLVEVTAEGNTYPGAINITHTEFASQCTYVDENLYIMFLSNTLHADVCDDFLDYLLDWQG